MLNSFCALRLELIKHRGLARVFLGYYHLLFCSSQYAKVTNSAKAENCDEYTNERYGSTLSGTLSLLFSPSGTKALMRQFVADAPKAHESLSTEARRVPVQGTPIPLISVFIVSSCFGTIWNDLFSTKITELLGLTVSISLDDSATAGGA